MTRVKDGTIHRARRKKVLKRAKGFFGSKHRLYKTAKEQVMHSLSYAYRDRRTKKRDFRKLWITRINAACRENEISYSKFINGLSKAQIEVNRKMLSEIAINDKESFAKLVLVAKGALKGEVIKEELKKETKPVVKDTKKETKSVVKDAKKEDLTKMTLVQLKEKAKSKKLSGYSSLKKADLIKALK